MNLDQAICPHFLEANPCNGCAYWDIDYNAELKFKKDTVKSNLNLTINNIRVKLAPESFNLRTRFDFTIQFTEGEFVTGLYSKNHKLVAINKCYVLRPELQKAYEVFKNLLKEYKPQISKGSVRIRISNSSDILGIWLDFSNIEIKKLLIEKKFLIALSKHFIIEIGQKSKRLDLNSFELEQLKLTEACAENWFSTQNAPLKSYISSFTQPSWQTADLLTEQILDWISSVNLNRVIEYGCGMGQFTIPLLSAQKKVDVFETDLKAIQLLQQNLPADKINDVQINPKNANFSEAIILVNPPRSGLNKFAEKLLLSDGQWIIYISCHIDSLKKDLKILQSKYKIKDIVIVDQFKRTLHFETMVLLQSIN